MTCPRNTPIQEVMKTNVLIGLSPGAEIFDIRYPKCGANLEEFIFQEIVVDRCTG